MRGTATLISGATEPAPLQDRLELLRRRRKGDARRTLAAAVLVVAIAWTVLIGLGLFLR